MNVRLVHETDNREEIDGNVTINDGQGSMSCNWNARTIKTTSEARKS